MAYREQHSQRFEPYLLLTYLHSPWDIQSIPLTGDTYASAKEMKEQCLLLATEALTPDEIHEAYKDLPSYQFLYHCQGTSHGSTFFRRLYYKPGTPSAQYMAAYCQPDPELPFYCPDAEGNEPNAFWDYRNPSQWSTHNENHHYL